MHSYSDDSNYHVSFYSGILLSFKERPPITALLKKYHRLVVRAKYRPLFMITVYYILMEWKMKN